jgi:ribonuclease P protein component
MISDGKIGPGLVPGREKFGKHERLIKTKDFRKVYEKGHKVFSGSAAIMILKNGLGHNRLGFSISKRNFKHAVTRNRIRRLFREVYRKSKKDLRTGFDLVLIIKKGFDKRSPLKGAEAVFLELAKRQGLLNDNKDVSIGNQILS